MTHEVDGLLVPIKNPDALAAGINRLIEDREFAERLGNNARKISEKVNGVSVQAQWREYIDEIIKSRY